MLCCEFIVYYVIITCTPLLPSGEKLQGLMLTQVSSLLTVGDLHCIVCLIYKYTDGAQVEARKNSSQAANPEGASRKNILPTV